MKFSWKWFLTGVAVPVIIAVPTLLITMLSTPIPKVRAVGDPNMYFTSPKLVTTYENVRALESTDAVRSKMKEQWAISEQEEKIGFDDSLLFQFSRELSDSFDTAWGSYRYSLGIDDMEQYYYSIVVTNSGSKVATNPTFQFPRAGYYRLSSPETPDTQGEFSDSIHLPDLKPGITHMLEIWTIYDLSLYRKNVCTISYDEGVVSVKFPSKTFNPLVPFLDTPASWIPIASGIILLMLLAFFAGNQMATITTKKTNSGEQKEPESTSNTTKNSKGAP